MGARIFAAHPLSRLINVLARTVHAMPAPATSSTALSRYVSARGDLFVGLTEIG
jgi:hypothetical protein